MHEVRLRLDPITQTLSHIIHVHIFYGYIDYIMKMYLPLQIPHLFREKKATNI